MNMRLELQKFNVTDIKFANKTSFESGTLYINKLELEEKLGEDNLFDRVEIELAHPGENVRIIEVMEAIEPRARRDGGDYPGVLTNPIEIVGQGVTDVLSGSAIILIDNTGDYDPKKLMVYGPVIEMSGPAAKYSVFSKTHNICILCYPSEKANIQSPEYKVAIKKAGFKASVYLASSCKDITPDETEIYDLPPLTEISKGKEELPKVVYVMNLYRYYFKEEYAFYGDTYRWTPSMLLHPNELFDGAVINPYLNTNGPAPPSLDTYTIQNHPIVKELYARHGKDLLFLGVIPTVAMIEDDDVVSHANLAIKLAIQLGADGAILTKATGGSPQMDVAHFAINASKYGIKSTLVMDDMAARRPDGKFSVNGIIFNHPDAGAMVNTGNIMEFFLVPGVERSIGHIKEKVTEPQFNSVYGIFGQGAQLGNTNLMEVKY